MDCVKWYYGFSDLVECYYGFSGVALWIEWSGEVNQVECVVNSPGCHGGLDQVVLWITWNEMVIRWNSILSWEWSDTMK